MFSPLQGNVARFCGSQRWSQHRQRRKQQPGNADTQQRWGKHGEQSAAGADEERREEAAVDGAETPQKQPRNLPVWSQQQHPDSFVCEQTCSPARYRAPCRYTDRPEPPSCQTGSQERGGCPGVAVVICRAAAVKTLKRSLTISSLTLSWFV